ncbi:hypothetical protein [Rossellomorea marisflavi]|uniref:hypothetical protein n=1 Tax=Rossellomorea marisflavi TaxID=189381 RepID=UPI0018CCAA25|nr:hypothetical protein [Rossellomorea marisflavi]
MGTMIQDRIDYHKIYQAIQRSMASLHEEGEESNPLALHEASKVLDQAIQYELATRRLYD